MTSLYVRAMRLVAAVAITLAPISCGSDDAAETEGEDVVSATSVDGPTELRATADSLFWITPAGLYRAPRRGGTPQRLLSGVVGVNWDSGYAADGGDVFAVLGGKLVKVPVLGGAQTQFSGTLPGTPQVVADASGVYVAGQSSVVRVARTLASSATVATLPTCSGFDSSVSNLLQDGTALYVNHCRERILRIEKATGVVTTVFSGNDISSFSIAGGKLYVVRNETLSTVSATGGTVTNILSGFDLPFVTAIEGAGYVFLWSIWKLEKLDLATKVRRVLRRFGAISGGVVGGVQAGTLKDAYVDGSEYFLAIGNRTRLGTAPGGDEKQPFTGTIERIRLR